MVDFTVESSIVEVTTYARTVDRNSLRRTPGKKFVRINRSGLRIFSSVRDKMSDRIFRRFHCTFYAG